MRTYVFKFILIIIALLNVNLALAQNVKVKKADKDFDAYSYIDARQVYIKVVEDGYASSQIYENLGDTYYWNSDYDNAANWYKKLINEFPDETDVIYYYRAAQSHKSINRMADAERYMEIYNQKGGNPGILNATSTKVSEYIIQLEKVSVNTEYSDFGPSFNLNKVVYASTKVGTEGDKIHNWNNQPFADLFEAQMDEKGLLSNAMPLAGDVNTRYHETSPTFTKDGKTMYFTRNNFTDGKKGRDKKKTVRLKLYKASKSANGTWENVVELPFNDENYSNAHPTLSSDEKRLYFSSEMPGSLGMSDLWYVDVLGNNSYGTPINLGPSINTEGRESFPFISESNKLFFSSDGRGGLGGFDIFMTQLNFSDETDEIINLGEPTNSKQDDFGFILNEERRFGYLSSNRDGVEGSINDDIYLVTEVCEITLTGKVYDEDTGEIIPGATVTLLDENNEPMEVIVVGEDAVYSFKLSCDEQYSVRGTKDSYTPFEQFVQTPNKTAVIEVPIPLNNLDPCPPNDLGCRLSLQPIYFDFDKHNIRPDAAIELAKIYAALVEYPQLNIAIESHTDSRAPYKYNEALSERRAPSTLNWLVDKGIDRNRLSAKGYGEYQLTNNCSDGVDCSEEEHQLNRRSMFIIQK